MGFLTEIGSWISQNETLLSGLAAIIVVAGVVLSAMGIAIRRVTSSAAGVDRTSRGRNPAAGTAQDSPGARTRDSGPPTPLTFQQLTAPSPHETRFAKVDGIRIAYNERGVGPPTIVFAPGIISHLHMMENLPASKSMLDCMGSFARVITFDKRGQGLSDPALSAPSLEERTEDMKAVMDDAGIERAIFIGVSEGGPMCLRLAASYPERVQGLVLLGTTARWLQSDDFPTGIPRRSLERLAQNWGRGVLRDVFFPSMSRAQIDDDTYRSFEALIGNRTAIGQVVDMMLATDLRSILPEIRVPALVVHFTGDLAVPIRLGRALADGLPNAEFLEVNAVDHADLTQSQLAVDRVREFCQRIAAADP